MVPTKTSGLRTTYLMYGLLFRYSKVLVHLTVSVEINNLAS